MPVERDKEGSLNVKITLDYYSLFQFVSKCTRERNFIILKPIQLIFYLTFYRLSEF